jgi:hypothetical protein
MPVLGQKNPGAQSVQFGWLKVDEKVPAPHTLHSAVASFLDSPGVHWRCKTGSDGVKSAPARKRIEAKAPGVDVMANALNIARPRENIASMRPLVEVAAETDSTNALVVLSFAMVWL